LFSFALMGSLFIETITEPISHSAFTIKLRFTSTKAVPKFYAYLFRSLLIRQTLSAQGNGTNISNLNQGILSGLEVPLPPTRTQRRIAAILSVYDDLIENNVRRIQILEEMARRIYEEWFVRFRFPGHENVGMIESELGLIPDGWEVKKLGLLIKRLAAGRTYRDNGINSEGDVIIIDQSTSEYLGFHNNQPDYYADPECPIIIFGDHTCKLQVMITPFSIGANTVPFVANDETAIYYLYNLIKGLVTTQEYKRHWTELNNKTVIKAPPNLCVQYDELVKPFFAAMDVFRIKNRKLRRTRDLLLPKLISGEIDVSNFPEPVSD
jgi:type I restriction enzyme, S subunit